MVADQAFGAEMGETLAIVEAEHQTGKLRQQVSGVWRELVALKFGSKPRLWERTPASFQARTQIIRRAWRERWPWGPRRWRSDRDRLPLQRGFRRQRKAQSLFG